MVMEDESEDAAKKRLMSKSSAIVFCNTCRMVQVVSELLRVFKVLCVQYVITRLIMFVCMQCWIKRDVMLP